MCEDTHESIIYFFMAKHQYLCNKWTSLSSVTSVICNKTPNWFSKGEKKWISSGLMKWFHGEWKKRRG